MKRAISLGTYTCSLCKLEADIDHIRYTNDGKKVICTDCYNKSVKDESKRIVDRPKAINKEDSGSNYSVSIPLICTDCNYKFSFRKEMRYMCPYCSGTSLNKYEEITPDRLIEEVSRKRER